MTSTRAEEPTQSHRRPEAQLSELLLVTTGRARDLRDACPGDPEVAAAVSGLLHACLDAGRQRAVLALVDRWQATGVAAGGHLSLHQLEDLRQYADVARDEAAYHACTVALRLGGAGRVPDEREEAAARTCLAAWNLRAARLRALGVRPLTGAPTAGGAS